jgi:pilus assembly protein CpaB
MRPARILLLVIALVAGGLAAYLATRGSAPQTVIQQVAAPEAQPASKVLVAKAPIGVGQRLSAAEVDWQPWPSSAVRPEYITLAKSPDAPAKIAGAVARFEIFTGEPILDAKLVHSDQGFLSAVLEPGMRGVSVPVSAASGSGGFIVPNDRVDVVVTNDVGGHTVSRVVLSDVKVLAIGNRLGQSGTTGAPADPNDPKSQIFNDTIATLELTPAQADTLINSTATGKVTLVLRSVADFAKTGPVGVGPAAPDNQSVKIIRFGREVSVMADGADQTRPTVNPAAFVPPVPVIVPAPPTVTTNPGTTITAPDGAVTVTAPTTTTVTTTTPAGATPVDTTPVLPAR